MNKIRLQNKNIYLSLRKAGFSKLAIRCYQALDHDDLLAAGKLADRLNKRQQSVQRILRQLGVKGFVEVISVRGAAARFRAVALDDALDRYNLYLRRELRPIIKKQGERRRELRRTA